MAMDFYRYFQKTKESKWSRIRDGEATPGGALYSTVLATTHDGSEDFHLVDVARFKGPYYVDFDAKDGDGNPDIGTATKDLNQFLDRLKTADVNLRCVRLYASGGRGFHVEVPAPCFMAREPDDGMENLPAIYRQMSLANFVESMDLNVYSGNRGRQWRRPNVRRENGKFKVPISIDEARLMTPERYAELTGVPRNQFPVPEAPQFAAGLFLIFEEAKEKLAANKKTRRKATTLTLAELSALEGDKLEIEIVKRAALGRIEHLLPSWLEGAWQGDHFVAKNPNRNDRNPGSFIIWSNGSWKDFAEEDAYGGDLVSLYAYLFGMESQRLAAFKLSGELSLDVAAQIRQLRSNEVIDRLKGQELVLPVSGKSSALRIVTGDWLAMQDFKPPRAIVEELLHVGATILAGPPKAGKSWWALDIAISVAAGVATIGGRSVYKGKVLYIHPDDTNKGRFKNRMLCVAATRYATSGLLDLHMTDVAIRIDNGLIEELRRLTEENRYQLIVLDSLAHFLPVGGNNQQRYLQEYGAMSQLRLFAEEMDLALLILHHTRKAESTDKIDAASGTQAITGAVDAAIIMRRLRGQGEATMFITGRNVEELDLGLRFDSNKNVFEEVGSAIELEQSAARQEVLNLMRTLGRHVTISEIVEATNKNRSAVQKLIDRMIEDGLIYEGERQGRAKTYRLP